MTLMKKFEENTENAHASIFSGSYNVFYSIIENIIWPIFHLSSANSFSTTDPKNLLFGKRNLREIPSFNDPEKENSIKDS